MDAAPDRPRSSTTALRRARVVGLACAVALAVAACGGSDGGETAAAPPPAAPTTEVAAEATAATGTATSDLRGVAIDVRRDPG
jgi:hypothetical protein